jgi:phosphohistidine phosphatase SixA
VLRHAATDWRREDATPVVLGDCSTQRNLSARGRADARRIGAGVRARGLRLGRVRTSPYCRTRETALLAFGRASRSAALLVWRPGTPAAITAHVERFRRLVATRPAPGRIDVAVTHTALIERALGLDLDEGEAAILLPRGGGRAVLVAVLGPRDWSP